MKLMTESTPLALRCDLAKDGTSTVNVHEQL